MNNNTVVLDFPVQVQKIIQANIRENFSSVDNEELASFLLNLYMMRTRNHISLVNTVAALMFPAFQKVGLSKEDFEVFLSYVELHDRDKLKNDSESIAIQTLGSVSKYSDAKDLYKPSQYASFSYVDTVIPKHIKDNPHHPESWAPVVKHDGKLVLNLNAIDLFNGNEKDPAVFAKGFRTLAEMVCDWSAVGIELKSTTAKEWFNQWYGKRWIADTTVLKLMTDLCDVAEEVTKNKAFAMPYEYSHLKWPTRIPDEPNQASYEDMFILTKTLKHQKLNALAKPLYNPVGQNSWEHIQQDVANGVYLMQQVHHRDITLQEYATILFHDCSVKSHPDKMKHSLVSADIAKPILEKTGFFNEEQISEIYQAIVEHDYEMNPEMKFSTDLSDFLASADFNPPNYAWILNKSYSWGISHGLDHNGRLQNVFTHIPKTYGSKGTITYPKLYSECYGSKIKEMQKFFDNMTLESCEQTIMEYRKRCGLSETDTQLPDPSKEAIADLFFFSSIGVEECSAESDKSVKDINFPPSEVDTLMKQDTIITTRVSADFNAFRRHDLVKTPWGAIFEVSQRFVIDDISKHPYYNELTKRQIAYLQKFDKIAVLTLTKVKDGSTEALSSKIEKNIVGDKVYHCSPFKLDVLRGSTSRTEGAKGSIFVSPFKHFASMFILNFQGIVDEIEKQIGKKHIQINNFGFKEWNQTPASTTSIPSVINVLVRTPEEFKPFEGKAKGYMYTIDFKRYRDNADMWTKAKNSDCEFIIHDNIVPEKCDEITINYTVQREEKEPRKSESSSEALNETKQEKKLTLKKCTGTDEEVKLLTIGQNDAMKASHHKESLSEDDLRNWMKRKNSSYFLVYEGSTPVGMTMIDKESKNSEQNHFTTVKTDYIEISEVSIFKEYRGKGYGTALMKAVIEYIKKNYPGYPCIVRCVPDNKAAVGLYKKSGFVVDKEYSNGKYDDGTDILGLTLRLKESSTEAIHSVMTENFIDSDANFYRVVYEGVGIYQAMKEHSSKQQWEEFLSTDAARWLPKPDCDYRPTYESYFTSLGYKTFMEKTESYLKKVLDPNKIRVQNYGNIDLSACVYQDPFQIVIDTRKLKDKPMIVDLFVDFE